MTLAPAPVQPHLQGSPAPAATVTAVLLLRDHGPWLTETLDSLARQTRPPERLLVVDSGADGEAVELVRGHSLLNEAVASVRFHAVPGDHLPGETLRLALAEDRAAGDSNDARDASDVVDTRDIRDASDPGAVEHVWVLTAGSAPEPNALARLLDAVRRSPSVGAAGPKLVRWDQPKTLESVGIQLTRSGRVIPSPLPGEPDQGQYDRRTDVLAVPLTGLLVERSLLEDLGGHDPVFGELGGDIDLSWRAHQAGRRVIVVPRATVRSRPLSGTEGGGSRRRGARRVALTRCSLWAAPFIAAWIAVSSLAAGLLLLAAKQPRAAWAELADLGAVLDPWRSLGARWRSRGTRSLRRRDLSGLFVRPGSALRHTADLLHDQVVLDSRPGDRPHAPVEALSALESGPVSDEALDLHVLSTSWMSKAARNPGVVAVATATVVTLFAGRNLPGGLLHRLETGLTGGELVGVRADSRTLWHAWLDGWHGAALGHSGEQSPHLAVLAALAWVGEHLPGADPASSPVGAAVAALLGLALPLATLTAYLAARVITRAGWARALAALAWSSTAVVTTAVGGGRLGAVVAAILLPLVAAGFALAARRGSRVMATAATALGCAVLGAFVPAMLVLGAAAALALLVLGRGRGPRLRGLALLLVPPALIGPWLLELIDSPYLLLSGPGLTLWGQETALPWQIALAHPGGPGSTPVLFTAPLVLAGVAGLLRGGRRSAAATSLAVLAVAGLTLALAAPRVTLGTVPVGVSQAGQPITAWPGIGLLPYVLALIAAALLGVDRLPLRRSSGGWLAVSRWPLWAAVAAAVLASAGWTAWRAVGSELSAWSDPRPAVAIDQAEGDPSNRMLLLETAGEQVHYRLLGREVSDVARSLPMTSAARPADSGLATAVGLIFEQGGSPDGPKPGPALAAQGVGFVGLRAEQTDPAIRTLDSVAGLSRLGEHQGVLFWRVLPADGAADAVVAPSRARILSAGGVQTVPVSGDHGRLSAEVTAGRGARLVMAEPAAWAGQARVTFNGETLRASPAARQPTYALPQSRGHLVVEVLPTYPLWRWAQLALLAAIAFLALPLGGRASRSRS